MIHYRMEQVNREVFDSFECDKCHKLIDDDLGLQETQSFEFIGGYSSVFGDGIIVSCDLCQECVYDLINDFCVTRELN